MRQILILSLSFFLLTTCKMEEDTVFITASVRDMSNGSTSFESGEYGSGQQLTFSATQNEGYESVEWINESTGQKYTTNPLAVSVNNDGNFVAVFAPSTFDLTVNVDGKGEVQKEIVSTKLDGELTLGSVVKLTAVPSAEHSFFYWNNDVNDTENPKNITINGNQFPLFIHQRVSTKSHLSIKLFKFDAKCL